jgi:hypothetical protein
LIVDQDLRLHIAIHMPKEVVHPLPDLEALELLGEQVKTLGCKMVGREEYPHLQGE